MIQPLRLTVCTVGVAVLATAGAAHAAALNVVRGLDVSRTGDETVVSIDGSQSPVYTVFKLENPRRVVVDLAGSDLSAVQGTAAGKGSVKEVAASQFTDGKQSVGRVVIALEDDARYDVAADGNKIVVKVGDHGAPAAAPAPAATKAEATKADATPAPVEKPAAAPEADKPAVAEAAAPQDSADPHLVRHEVLAKTVDHPATRVLGAKVTQKKGATRLDIATDAAVGTYELLELRDPSRLAIDLKGVKGNGKLKVAAAGPIKDVRAGKQADGVRLVLDTDELAPGSYRIERTHKGLAVVFGAPVEVATATVAAPVASTTNTAGDSTKPVAVKDVAFKGDDSKADVAIAVPHGTAYEVTHPDAHTAVLTLRGAQLPDGLERSLDTSAFGGPVKMVSSFNTKTPGEVQLVATLDGEASDVVTETPRGLRWAFTGST